MKVRKACIERLLAETNWSYLPAGPGATEPTAWGCLALAEANEWVSAQALADELATFQNANGSVGVVAGQSTPAWTTSLAVLAWLRCLQHTPGNDSLQQCVDRAIGWTLQEQGRVAPPSSQVGHDPSLVGWSWAADTHSWLEPTAMFVLALKAAGYHDHSRTREAVRLIVDRLLPEGGCNYGNTFVLGQLTLPQVQPTGIAMLALADEATHDPRVEKSLRYLESNIGPETTTSSLCFGLMALSAFERRPASSKQLLQEACQRTLERGESCYKVALLLLALHEQLSWLPQLDLVGVESN